MRRSTRRSSRRSSRRSARRSNRRSNRRTRRSSGRRVARRSSGRRAAPRSSRRTKKLSPWIQHVMNYHQAHPELSYKQSMKAAQYTYKKGGDPMRTLSKE